MKVLILDDKTTDLSKLKEILASSEKDLEIEGTIDSSESILDWLNNNPAPDLILVNKKVASEIVTNNLPDHKVKTIITFSTENGDFNFEAYKFNNESVLTNGAKHNKRKLTHHKEL